MIFDSEREWYSFKAENIFRDVGIGIAIGFVFIVLNVWNPSIAIGIPIIVSLSVAGRWFVASILAPVAEEAFFSIGVFGFFNYYFHWAIAIFVRSLLFMLFHLAAYGASLQGLPTAFFAAFMFSIISAILTKATKSVTASTVTHALFNTFLGASKLVVVGV